jgi:hypothetical protein
LLNLFPVTSKEASPVEMKTGGSLRIRLKNRKKWKRMVIRLLIIALTFIIGGLIDVDRNLT